MPDLPPKDASPVDRLVAIMAVLRSPRGCPWDREQSLVTLKPHLVEETYEVLEAIDAEDRASLCGELGDVLLQVVFQSQLCSEEGSFCFDDVVEGLNQKLIRRHPHVFGEAIAEDADAVLRQWDVLKRGEEDGKKSSALGKISSAMPALHRAYEVQKRAARLGYDWEDVGDVRAKVHEEIDEFADSLMGEDPLRTEEELGDLLFSLVNLARHLGSRPEEVLRRATDKFAARVEAAHALAKDRGQCLSECTPEELDALWGEVKQEKPGPV